MKKIMIALFALMSTAAFADNHGKADHDADAAHGEKKAESKKAQKGEKHAGAHEGKHKDGEHKDGHH
jgi:hypothetical protein